MRGYGTTLGVRGYELDSNGSGQGPMAGSCVHGNEPSGFIKTDLFTSSEAIFFRENYFCL